MGLMTDVTASAHDLLRDARDLLLELREDQAAACERFDWPRPAEFNFALDWFDVVAQRTDRAALWIVEEDGSQARLTYAELSERSNRVANWLRGLGVARGDRIIVMLGNQVELWETVLAAMKLGAVVIPATTLLAASDLEDRVTRGNAKHIVTREPNPDVPGTVTRIAVTGGGTDGWHAFGDAYAADPDFAPDGPTRADDTLLLYFTSGTTAKPKLVEHTHTSYPIGHLSTMYWLGLQPGDIHCTLSSPGWAKHAWGCFFAPFLAEATILIFNYERFEAGALLSVLERTRATSFCAPPTVWRMLIQADLSGADLALREVVGAGEPLNPEIIESVRRSLGLTIRDGFGQTETTCLVGNGPGQPLKEGSMGRALPGYAIELVEGEICLGLDPRPVGLMVGYRDDPERNDEVLRGGYYHTGDVAELDEQGYITFVGRTDDVFKGSGYRISPFELESVLLEHEAIAEAAVVPSPDPVRTAVPKAYVALAGGRAPDAETARAIFEHSAANLAGYKRIRKLEFAELPKTISGKIRRVELRKLAESASEGEFAEADFK